MSERETRDAMLARFNAGQFEAPTSDTNLRKVAQVFRETIKDQGQVMSLALDNNHNLYHANKELRQSNASLSEEVQHLSAGIDRREATIRELTEQIETLNSLTTKVESVSVGELQQVIAECAQWKATAIEYRRVLESYLYEELNQTQLRDKLDAMKAQKAEIVATGQVHEEKPEE
jgi:translation initiation factor RLI1